MRPVVCQRCGSRHPFDVSARIQRATPIEGMRPVITLTLIHDDDAVELSPGDEFATIRMAFDPWLSTPPDPESETR